MAQSVDRRRIVYGPLMVSLLSRILGIAGTAAKGAPDDVDELSRPAPAAGARQSDEPTGRAASASEKTVRPSPPRAPAQRRAPGPAGSAGEPPSAPERTGVGVYDVASRGLPDIVYSPDPDGEPDPGEVVWTWVPYEEDAYRGKDRPVLVLARQADPGGRLVVTQMTNRDHDRDAAQEARWGRYWHDVGTGDWDSRGRPSEVRLDRLLVVEPSAVRREGATMCRDVFDGVVAALRAHWARSVHGDAGGCRPGAGRVVRKRDAPHAADGERARSC